MHSIKSAYIRRSSARAQGWLAATLVLRTVRCHCRGKRRGAFGLGRAGIPGCETLTLDRATSSSFLVEN